MVPHIHDLWHEPRSALHARQYEQMIPLLDERAAQMQTQEFDQLLGYVYASVPEKLWRTRHDTAARRLLRHMERWRHPDALPMILAENRTRMINTLRYTQLPYTSITWTIFAAIPVTPCHIRQLQTLWPHLPATWVLPLLTHHPQWSATLLDATYRHHAHLASYFSHADIKALCTSYARVALARHDDEAFPHVIDVLTRLCTQSSHAYTLLHHTLSTSHHLLHAVFESPEPSRSRLLDLLGFAHLLITYNEALPSEPPSPPTLEELSNLIREEDDLDARLASLLRHYPQVDPDAMTRAQWTCVMRALDHAPRHEERLRLLSLLSKCEGTQAAKRVLGMIHPWIEDGTTTTRRAGHRGGRGRVRRAAPIHPRGEGDLTRIYGDYEEDFFGYYSDLPPLDYGDYEEDFFGYYSDLPPLDYRAFTWRLRQSINQSARTRILNLSFVDESFLLEHLDELPEDVDALTLAHLRGDLAQIRALLATRHVTGRRALCLDMSYQPTRYLGFRLIEQYIHTSRLHERARRRATSALSHAYSASLCESAMQWLHAQPEATSLEISLHEISQECAIALTEAALHHPTLTRLTLRGVERAEALLARYVHDPRIARFTALMYAPHEYASTRPSALLDVDRLHALLDASEAMHPEAVAAWRDQIAR